MTVGDFTFLRPLWCLALLPLAGLIWYWWRAPARDEAIWHQLVDAHLRAHVLVNGGARKRRPWAGMLGVAGVLVVLALAGPAVKQTNEPLYQRDVARVLVVELTPAMQENLDRVKVKLLALLQAFTEGQTALLVYGGEPYLVVPPTTDAQTIARFVPELEVDVIPVPGNRPELAMRMAGEVLARSGSGRRNILWVRSGGADYVPSAAELGGARLFILPLSANADVGQLLADMQSNNGWVAGAKMGQSTWLDLGYWLLLPLLPLGALVFRRGIFACLLAPVLITGLFLPRPALALDFSALTSRHADTRWAAVTHYRAGEYARAAEIWAGHTDADSHYNRGNALAKQGQLVEALSAYESGLQLRPDDADMIFNHDLVRRLLNPPPQPPQSGKGDAPPPPSGQAELEAQRVAEQWLRGVPDNPASLLRRKLLAEQQRRQASRAGGKP